jgi:hypothetical protein
MSVAVIFARSVMGIHLWRSIKGSKLLKPFFVVLMQAGLVIVDEYRRRNVHRIDKDQSFLDSAFPHGGGNLRGDVHKIHPLWNIDGNDFSI